MGFSALHEEVRRKSKPTGFVDDIMLTSGFFLGVADLSKIINAIPSLFYELTVL